MSDHMKRLAAPRSWPLKRKASTWVAKQSPGAHSVESSMPAVTVLRDMIGVCDTAKEAKKIIGNREVLLDGVPLKNPKAPIGFMDVVSIPKTGKNYRMLLNDKGKLTMVGIGDDEAKWKLCRIEDKTRVKDGKIQLNLSGGRNMILDKNGYKTGDVLKIALEDQSIMDVYHLSKGAAAMVITGVHAGKTYTVSDYVEIRGPSPNIIRFDSGSETVKDNVFVVGTQSPAITLPEASQ